MRFCPKCGERIEEGSIFCQNCGTAIEKITPKPAAKEEILGKVEQTVYFRFARGYAWVLIAVAFIALIGFIIFLAPPLLYLAFGGDTKVSAEDIRRKLAEESGIRRMELRKINPKLLARLDEAIYETIRLLPLNVQADKEYIERLRARIKDRIDYMEKISDQIAAVQELNGALKGFVEREREDMIDKFFEVKREKEREAEEEKERAEAKLRIGLMSILAIISFITFATMILVLLAVERNTRIAIARG